MCCRGEGCDPTALTTFAVQNELWTTSGMLSFCWQKDRIWVWSRRGSSAVTVTQRERETGTQNPGRNNKSYEKVMNEQNEFDATDTCGVFRLTVKSLIVMIKTVIFERNT